MKDSDRFMISQIVQQAGPDRTSRKRAIKKLDEIVSSSKGDTDDSALMFHAAYQCGFQYLELGDIKGAKRMLRRSLDCLYTIYSIGKALYNHLEGHIWLHESEPARAEEHFRSAQQDFFCSGEMNFAAVAQRDIAQALYRQGNLEGALNQLEETVEFAASAGCEDVVDQACQIAGTIGQFGGGSAETIKRAITIIETAVELTDEVDTDRATRRHEHTEYLRGALDLMGESLDS